MVSAGVVVLVLMYSFVSVGVEIHTPAARDSLGTW